MEAHEPDIAVEVAYALPCSQTVRALTLPAGSTVEQAIDASGILRLVPGIDLRQNRVGIYGKLAKPDTILRNRDRVEIYRPLLVDPKEARRRRAGKAAKEGDRQGGTGAQA